MELSNSQNGVKTNFQQTTMSNLTMSNLNYIGNKQTKSNIEYALYKFEYEGFYIEARVFKYKVRFVAVCNYSVAGTPSSSPSSGVANGVGYCSYFLPLVTGPLEFYNNQEKVLEAAISHTKRKAFWMENPNNLFDDKGVPYQAYMEIVGHCVAGNPANQVSPLPGEVKDIYCSIMRYPKNSYVMVYYVYQPIEEGFGNFVQSNLTDQVLLKPIPEEKFNLDKILKQLREKLIEQGYDLSW